MLRRRARSARTASPTSAVPRQAIHSGTNASIGICVAEHQRAEPADLADRQRVVARRQRRPALLLEEEVGEALIGASRSALARPPARTAPASARAPSARPGDGRVPGRQASAMPGARSENGLAARSAASTQAVRRAILFGAGKLRRAANPTRARTRPPPLPPSNCFVCHPAPRATDFHAMRCSGSPGW